MEIVVEVCWLKTLMFAICCRICLFIICGHVWLASRLSMGLVCICTFVNNKSCLSVIISTKQETCNVISRVITLITEKKRDAIHYHDVMRRDFFSWNHHLGKKLYLFVFERDLCNTVHLMPSVVKCYQEWSFWRFDKNVYWKDTLHVGQRELTYCHTWVNKKKI